MGKNGKEHVKNNFLITRVIMDWLSMFENYLDRSFFHELIIHTTFYAKNKQQGVFD